LTTIAKPRPHHWQPALTSDKAYQRLAHLTDHIGNRLSGSQNLERAIEWAVSEMKKDGLDNVHPEK
jgi:carboxypeptidase Q